MTVEKGRILIVDDEKDLREVLEFEVRDLGFDILLAANGYEALECLRFNKVDAVVSDLNMPELGGVQLLRAMRASGFMIPFIVTAGFGSRSETIELMKHGVFDFFEKPVNPDLLRDSLKRAVKMSKSLAVAKEGLLKTVGSSMDADRERAVNELALLKALRAVS